MKLTPAILSRVVTLSLALGLASCSLPPEAAWHVVKTDGLIPLIAMELGARPFPKDLAMYSRRPAAPLPITRPLPSNNYIGSVYDRPTPVLPPRPVIRNEEGYKPKPLPTRPDAIVGTANRQQATSRPPRPNLVTKGRNDGSGPKVVIGPKTEHAPPVIATGKPKSESEAEPEPESKPEAKSEPKPQSEPKPEPKRELATTPTPSKPFTPAAQPPVRAIEESLPYGIAIAGRPGLVNSPYAAKNQFVDVAGLKPGQEVKCPYSGKLFRVPVGAQASGPKPSEEDKKQ
ncbi:MAG: hypothetical protein JWO89_345 [Verrucomicrobiaceae bacterium]|nr:hypothetical protein [Verrucomicrobiaceae bacterium]